MNISKFYQGLIGTNNKLGKLIENLNRANGKNNGACDAFIEGFESLTPTERSSLKQTPAYREFIIVYDQMKAGKIPTKIETQRLDEIRRNMVDLITTFKKNNLRSVVQSSVSALTVKFPLRTMQSNPLDFAQEINWFFSGLTSAQPAFDGLSDDLIITSLSNDVFEIVVNVDWKFLLIIYLFWRNYQSNNLDKANDQSLLSKLRDRGVKDDLVNKIKESWETEDKLPLNDAIQSVENDIEAIIGELAEENPLGLLKTWKTNIRGLAKKLKEAAEKGYKLEIEFRQGRFDRHPEVKKLGPLLEKIEYNRELDDSEYTIERLKITDDQGGEIS